MSIKSMFAGLAVLLAAASLSACHTSASSNGPPPLQGSSIGGPFTLVGPNGQTVHYSDFNGKYRMIYFGYTWCPNICPFDLNRMMTGYRLWAKDHAKLENQVQPIFITVDPARDTPAKMKEYTAKFGPNLIGLTGTPAQIKEAARQFSVYYKKGPKDPNVGYTVNHSRYAYLMGRKGKAIALLPADKSAKAVAAVLTKWVH